MVIWARSVAYLWREIVCLWIQFSLLIGMYNYTSKEDKYLILHFKTKHAFSVFSSIPFLAPKVKKKKKCVHKDSSCNIHSSFVCNSHELKVSQVHMNNKKEKKI